MSQCGKITCKIFDSCNIQYISIKANKRCLCTTTLYYSFKSKNITVTTKNTISLIQPTFLPLTFWFLSETFIKRTEEVWLILLQVLATIVMRRGKKSVVAYVWPAATVLDRESDKSTRWIKEAVHTQKEGYDPWTGQGQLHAEPHARPISCHVASLSWQEPEEELNKLLLILKVSDRDRNVKAKNVGCVLR